jgi:hypothetical protein
MRILDPPIDRHQQFGILLIRLRKSGNLMYFTLLQLACSKNYIIKLTNYLIRNPVVSVFGANGIAESAIIESAYASSARIASSSSTTLPGGNGVCSNMS